MASREAVKRVGHILSLLAFILILVVAEAMVDGSGELDCKYENPELHLYVDQIDSCLP